ncbi:MAG TPA: deoxyribonuclease V [Thermodesulfobacteriota bacterium]|nr:deoxyribonuclease V [Thermodesulfobacteriota bacterium]
MRLGISHSWNVSPHQAARIQEDLARKVILKHPASPFTTIAAGDVAYARGDERIFAVVLLFTYPGLILLESASAASKVSFQYIPGLFSFREAPVLLKAFSRLKTKPDLILVEGQGIAHPRSLGIASHLGLILDVPSIGCAKSRLFGDSREPGPERGSRTPLLSGWEEIGAVLRTRTGVKPVFVSPGHKIDLETSVAIVLSTSRGYRLPEPLRLAHIQANRRRKEHAERQAGLRTDRRDRV